MEKRKIEHIYWFAYYNLDSPSVRYRGQYPLDYAKKELNISNDFVIPGYHPTRIIKFLTSYLSALLFPKKNSIIIIQRVHSNFIYSNLLKLLVHLRKKRTVYDLDDADYLDKDPKTIHYFAKNCNSISSGSPAISNYLKPFNTNIIHTTSPTPDLGILKSSRNKILSIGWIGGYGWGHKESLYLYLFPALKGLEFECELTLIGVTKEIDKQELFNYFKDQKHVKVNIINNVDWHNEISIQKMIMKFDVGIATLLNHPLQLAKSGIKAKQYMNNGVPVICNDLPENNNVVIHGYNGFVCKTSDEFSKKLTEFHEMNDAEYFKYSENSRASIKHFNHSKYFKELKMILD